MFYAQGRWRRVASTQGSCSGRSAPALAERRLPTLPGAVYFAVLTSTTEGPDAALRSWTRESLAAAAQGPQPSDRNEPPVAGFAPNDFSQVGQEHIRRGRRRRGLSLRASDGQAGESYNAKSKSACMPRRARPARKR